MQVYDEMWKELGLDVELHKEVLGSIGKSFEEQVLSQKCRPAAMGYFDGVIHNAHGSRVQEIIDRRRNGGKFIGTFCIYVPDEIAIALGAVPVALCGGTAFSIPYAEKVLPRDICPLVKSTLGLAFSKTCPYAPIKDLAVGETTCDAKKKAWDMLSKKVPFHIMEVPQKKQDADKALWLGEVIAFKERVEKLTGNRLEKEKLAAAIRLMDRKRNALSELHSFRKLDPPPISGLDFLVVMQAALNDDNERFCRKIGELNAELKERAQKGTSPARKGARRIMVAGCPSVMGNWKLHHLIELAGAAVVCDESCTGTRYFSDTVSRDGVVPDGIDGQLNAIAERYMKIDCPCFSPNDERMENIVRLASEYKADGVVQYVLQYCHGYNVESVNVSSALRKAGVPNLKIETDYSQEDLGQLRTRIEAFLESIEIKNAAR